MSLIQRLLDTCDNHADRVAMVNDDGSSFTFAELGRVTRQWCTLLTHATKRPHVGILLPSCKEFGAAFFAIAATGRVPVPLNLLLSPEELAYVAQDAGLDAVVTSRAFAKLAPSLVDKPIYVEELYRKPAALATRLHQADDNDTLVLLYTSGTIAQPRGVELTHHNIESNIGGILDAVAFDEDDVMVCALPLFHSFAFTTMLALPVCVGIKTAYLPRFSAPRTLQLLEEHKATVLIAIASIFRLLSKSDELARRDLSSLRLCVSGGEALPMEVTKAFNAVFPARLLEGYGLTETSPVVCVNRPDRHKDGTAGLPIGGVEVTAAGADDKRLPANVEGEIWTRGPHIMKGYFNRPAETAEVMTEDGWFKTGDMGVIDAEGFVKITGRLKELIISSGENISPMEIEEVILAHPAVFEAAVVAAPDPNRGEVPKAYVALHEGAAADERELRAHCRKHLPPYKTPRYWEFRDKLPHGPTGKLLRRALRQGEDRVASKRT